LLARGARVSASELSLAERALSEMSEWTPHHSRAILDALQAAASEQQVMPSAGKQDEVWRMRVEVDPAAVREEPVWPEGVRVRTWRDEDAESLHALLVHSYRHGGGSVAPFETWLPQMTSDAEFDPEVWFVAESEAVLVGAALCWSSAFVKDLVVHESWRRRGLGEALLLHVLRVFAARGAAAVELKVQAGNRPAVRLYERVGMRVAERLQRD
jgi:ribosomal protein S18 acetylase RimI-like enzyme